MTHDELLVSFYSTEDSLLIPILLNPYGPILENGYSYLPYIERNAVGLAYEVPLLLEAL